MHTHLAVLGLLCAVSIVPALAAEFQCAGNVQAEVVNGEFRITGDDQPNCITLDSNNWRPEGEPQPYVLEGFLGTTVNGGTLEFDAVDVTRDVTIKLGGGDDYFPFGDDTATFPADLKIDLGDGDDYVGLIDIRALGNITIKGGDGNDIGGCVSCVAGKKYSVSMGDGDDRTGANEAIYFGTRASISMGPGNDTIWNIAGIEPLDRSGPAPKVILRTGSGNDTVWLEDAEHLALSLGGGDDYVRLVEPIGDTTTFLHGGPGFDTLGTVKVRKNVPFSLVVRSFEDWKPYP